MTRHFTLTDFLNILSSTPVDRRSTRRVLACCSRTSLLLSAAPTGDLPQGGSSEQCSSWSAVNNFLLSLLTCLQAWTIDHSEPSRCGWLMNSTLRSLAGHLACIR